MTEDVTLDMLDGLFKTNWRLYTTLNEVNVPCKCTEIEEEDVTGYILHFQDSGTLEDGKRVFTFTHIKPQTYKP